MARDAFGRLLGAPDTWAERVDELRRLVGRLAADSDRGSQWFAGRLQEWLVHGGTWTDVLGVRPAQGSRRTIAALLRLERQDAALLRLAVAVGCDRAALAMLRGDRECPAEHRHLLDAARKLRVPTGPHAVSRARDRRRRMT